MNALLESLVDKSQLEVWGTNMYNGAPEYEGSELDIPKFVGLILDECIKEARKEMPDYDSSDAYTRGRCDGILDVIVGIKNLFE
jgi:hypothetical protein